MHGKFEGYNQQSIVPARCRIICHNFWNHFYSTRQRKIWQRAQQKRQIAPFVAISRPRGIRSSPSVCESRQGEVAKHSCHRQLRWTQDSRLDSEGSLEVRGCAKVFKFRCHLSTSRAFAPSVSSNNCVFVNVCRALGRQFIASKC